MGPCGGGSAAVGGAVEERDDGGFTAGAGDGSAESGGGDGQVRGGEIGDDWRGDWGGEVERDGGPCFAGGIGGAGRVEVAGEGEEACDGGGERGGLGAEVEGLLPCGWVGAAVGGAVEDGDGWGVGSLAEDIAGEGGGGSGDGGGGGVCDGGEVEIDVAVEDDFLDTGVVSCGVGGGGVEADVASVDRGEVAGEAPARLAAGER